MIVDSPLNLSPLQLFSFFFLTSGHKTIETLLLFEVIWSQAKNILSKLLNQEDLESIRGMARCPLSSFRAQISRDTC